jgi:hypothetical protein
VETVDRPLVRVVGAALTDEELAALTAALLARVAAGQPATVDPADEHRRARWQRLDRLPSYRSPTSWR